MMGAVGGGRGCKMCGLVVLYVIGPFSNDSVHGAAAIAFRDVDYTGEDIQESLVEWYTEPAHHGIHGSKLAWMDEHGRCRLST